MSCPVGRSYFGRAPRNAGKVHKVRTELWFDIIDAVVDGGVQDCEIAGRVNGSWLSAGRPNDCQKSSIPLNDGVDGLGRILFFIRRCLRNGSEPQESGN
jgi:hypothetical protein